MSKERKEGIKSALELAMEKIDGGKKVAALSPEQKARIAEVEQKAAAGIAEVDIMTGQRLAAARAAGDADEVSRIEKERAAEIARIREKAEKEKEAVRGRGADAP